MKENAFLEKKWFIKLGHNTAVFIIFSKSYADVQLCLLLRKKFLYI